VIYTTVTARRLKKRAATFDRAGVSGRITLHTGDALEFLSEQKQEYDIIFNDVDKEDYPRVFKLVLPRLRKVACSSPTTFCGAEGWRRKSVEASTRAILELTGALWLARLVYDHLAYPGWSCRGSEKVG